MSRVRPALRARRVLLGPLLLLAVAALLLQGASLPHSHASARPGLYNQDHDSTLLATLHSIAMVAEAAPVPLGFALVGAIALLAIRPPASAARPTCESRAPPLA
jgi:hypothetical protein